MSSEIIVVDNLTKRFGGLTANANISFSIKEGEIIGLMDPTGRGNPHCSIAYPAFTTPTAGESFSRDRILCVKTRNRSAGWV